MSVAVSVTAPVAAIAPRRDLLVLLTLRIGTLVVAVAVAAALSAVALAPFLGWSYLALAGPAAAGFLALALAVRRGPTTARAGRTFKLSGVHLLCFLAGVVAGAPT